MSWGLIDVVRVHHASVKSVKLATNGKNAFFELVAILSDNLLGNVEIELMTDQSEAKPARLALTAQDRTEVGKFHDEELVVVDERIVVEEETPFLPLGRRREALQGGTNLRDNRDEVLELFGRDRVELEPWRPRLDDELAFGPAEALPDGFSKERRKGVEHFEDRLKSDLEQGNVLVDLLTFDEPVGVFVPDDRIEGFDGFGEAIVGKVVFDLFFGGGELAADPIFTKVVGRVGKLATSLDGSFVDDRGVKFVRGNFESGKTIGMRLIDHTLDKTSDIPEFVAEVATGDDRVLRESLVHTGGTATKNTETESVRAVLGDELNRVNNVAFRFRHFLTMSVKY